MTSPVEWNKQEIIEKESAMLEDKLKLQGPYNVYRAVNEVDLFLEVVKNDYHLNFTQREYLNRTRLTFDKVFKYKQ
jgi:hypothetical protein|tara:strand:+ start:91 stop:318 length:228 start_codon:yes stop_codon:yes gene_type:complete